MIMYGPWRIQTVMLCSSVLISADRRPWTASLRRSESPFLSLLLFSHPRKETILAIVHFGMTLLVAVVNTHILAALVSRCENTMQLSTKRSFCLWVFRSWRMTALWIYTKIQALPKHRCQQLCGDEGVSLELKGLNVFFNFMSIYVW